MTARVLRKPGRLRHALVALAASVVSLAAAVSSARAEGDTGRYFVGDGTTFDAALDIGEGGSARLFLFHRMTNEPVANAQVSLQGSAGDIAFKATADAGVYEAKIASGGEQAGNIIVQTEADADAIELAVPAYRAAKAAAAKPGGMAAANTLAATAYSKRELYFAGGGLLAGLAFGVILLVALLARRAKAGVRGGQVALLAIGLSTLAGLSLRGTEALAHADHDHGGGEAAADTGAGDLSGMGVVLAKASQLLLGLRTLEAKTEATPGVLQAFGHIIARPQNDALIVAPQAGFVRGLRGLLPGRVVRRGETLGYLQAVAQVPLKSPIDGEIIEVEAVEGSRVEAGTKLLRVTNRTTLWVDAELFQAQLARLEEVEQVVVSVDGYEKALPAKMINAPSPINEATRTAKVFVELGEAPRELRLGSFAKIHFTLKSRREGVSLPVDAVLSRAGEPLVFVKTGPETFEPRAVSVIDGAEPGTVVVTRGLADGDRVVTTGNYQLLMKAK